MKSPWPLLHGRVYGAKLSTIKNEKYFLVVSNNRRNVHLPQVLAVRLTTSPKPSIPSIVELGKGEVFLGRAICDDIVELYEDEITRDLGALSSKAMAEIANGLKAALSL
ncbi:MAG: type II toxin-antitoxin system PemK/MazF family toxin [Actinobacteria bacterium]|nr:type II toxin-antitoxin system PemK/MazF family toxin [Actinomycetota bacterium]